MPRFTLAETLGPAKFLTLTRRSFEEFLIIEKRLSNETKSCLRLVLGGNLVDELRSVAFLKNGSDRALSILTSFFDYEFFPQDSIVYSRDDIGDKMYIVASGSIDCSKVTSKDHDVPYTRASAIVYQPVRDKHLHTGDHFGDMALMMLMPRSFTATCATNVLLLCLSRAVFNSFVEYFPNIKFNVKSEVKTRMTQLFQSYSVPFFKAIPSHM